MPIIEDTIVGTFTIDEPRSYRYSISETASRYEEVLLDAGTYEVIAKQGHPDAGEVRLSTTIPGTVTSCYDGSEYGGVRIGSSPQYDKHPNVGKTTEVRYSPPTDDIVWNDTAPEVLCWRWLTGFRHLDDRLALAQYKGLRWTVTMYRPEFEIRTPSDLPEMFNDPYAYMLRVNECLDAGVRPETFKVSCDRATGEISRRFPEHTLDLMSFAQ